MIKREEWPATEPRHIQRVNGLANNIILWHTDPGTCKLIELYGSNCQRCNQDEGCMTEHLAAFQAADLCKCTLLVDSFISAAIVTYFLLKSKLFMK